METNVSEQNSLVFNNTGVVITDPCYLMKTDKHGFNNLDGWDFCDYGSRMDKLGFHEFTTLHNGFGDGTWRVNNFKTMKKLGEIWADSGQTGIYLLQDIKSYNPGCVILKSTAEHSYGAVIFKNFTGKISWSFRESSFENPNPEFTKLVNVLHKMGITVDEAKKMGMKIDEPQVLTSHYLVIETEGTCDGQEIEFSVDFGFPNMG